MLYWYQYVEMTLPASTSEPMAATLGRRAHIHANGVSICQTYQGRLSDQTWSSTSPGRRKRWPRNPVGPPNGKRQALRVGVPIRPRMTTYIATSMKATL